MATVERFVKKPVVIEAHRWNDERGWPDEWIPIPDDWSIGEDADGVFLAIPTLEGVMQCREGDWIIRGIKGEFYPCKPDIFEATYEPVGEEVSG